MCCSFWSISFTVLWLNLFLSIFFMLWQMDLFSYFHFQIVHYKCIDIELIYVY